MKFDPEGELVSSFGAGQVITKSSGTDIDRGPEANALAIDEAGGFLYAANSRSGEESAVQRFALPAEGPLPEGLEAKGVSPTGATLAATLNPEGHATTYRFEYLTQAAYEEQGGFEGPATQSTEPQVLAGSGFQAEEVSAAIESLVPETAYRLRILASNADGEVEAQATFTTRPAVAIEAQWASWVAAHEASLRAELDPLGAKEPTWWVQYGEGGSLDRETAHLPLEGPETVSARLSGLAPATRYSYRFVAEGIQGADTYTSYGKEQGFTTPLAAGFSPADSRAWEMVSPAEKHGGAISLPYQGEAQIQAAADGEAVAYLSAGSIEARPEGARAPERSSVISRRGVGGQWGSRDIATPNASFVGGSVGFGSEYRLFGPELATALVTPHSEAPLAPAASERTPYVRANTDPPAYTPLLSACPAAPAPCPAAIAEAADVPAGTEFGSGYAAAESAAHVEGATAGLEHVVLRSEAPLVAGVCHEVAPETGRWSDSGCSEADAKHEGDWEGPGEALYEWSAAAPAAQRLRALSAKPGDEGGAVVRARLGSGGGSVRGAISGEGSRVFWSALSGSIPSGLYLRSNATEPQSALDGEGACTEPSRACTIRLDSEREGAFGSGAVYPLFQGASADGTVAFFTDTRNLTPDANESGADLYRWQAPGSGACEEPEGCLSDLSATHEIESAEVQGLLAGMSKDASRAYFLAKGVLAGENAAGASPLPGQPNLYLWEAGAGTRFIATLGAGDSHDWGGFASELPPLASPGAEQSAAASPSGRYLAFMSAQELTGYDNRDAVSGEADQEVFLYDAAADSGRGRLTCASCNPSGARPAGVRGRRGVGGAPFYDFEELWKEGTPLAATLPDAPRIELQEGPSVYRPRVVHDNGRLYFNAADSLVSADSNGTWDVYQYEPSGVGSCSAASADAGTARLAGGCVSLLSSGTGSEEAAFLDAGQGGSDVFFFTPARLSVTDVDDVYDVYDARVDGEAARLSPSAECQGEACQPPATPPASQTPSSSTFRGPANPPLLRNCSALSRRVKKASHRARRLRRQAKPVARNPQKRRAARRMNRKAARLAHRARGLSKRAKRCRRANRKRSSR